MPTPRLSIVSKLALLVLGAAVPLAAILAWSIAALFRNEVAAAQQQAGSIANAIAVHADVTVDQTRSLLREVAKRPLVQAMDGARCDPFLAELRQLLPGYANINTFNLQWEFVCSASLRPGVVVRSAYPELYERMRATDGMVIGPPVRGQLTGKWVVIAAHPVKDAANNLIGAVTAPIDLSVLAPAIAGMALPADGLTGVINRDGVVIISYPDVAGIGKAAEGIVGASIAKGAGPSIASGAPR